MGFIFLRHKSDNGSFTQRARNSPNLQEDTNWVAGYFLGWVGVRHFSIKIFFPKGRGGKVKSAQVCGVGFAIVFFGLLFGELRRSQPGGKPARLFKIFRIFSAGVPRQKTLYSANKAN